MNSIVMFVTSNLVHDNRVRREAETLAEAGYQVTVFSYTAPRDAPRLGWQGQTAPRAVPVELPLWMRTDEVVRGPLGRVRRTIALSSSHLRWGGSHTLAHAARNAEADFYHAHDLDTLAVAAWIAKRYRAQLVYDTHELFLDQMALDVRMNAASWDRRLVRRMVLSNFARLERTLIHQAAAVIIPSSASADEIASQYRIPRPTVVLNCPRFQDMGAGSEYLRRRLGLQPTEPIILSQGAVLPGRGQLELVQSLSHLPERYRLVFLGFNLGTLQEPIRQEIGRLGLWSRVHLLDALPPEELPDATASADVGIILLTDRNKNHRYAMPNKLFEYMMAGLPFVANGLPEISRVAAETGAGRIIENLTPEAIAEGVQTVLADPDRLQRMRVAGLNAARTEYNWERQAQTLLALYARLCKTSSLPTSCPQGIADCSRDMEP